MCHSRVNHPVDVITKNDLPGNEAKRRKSLSNGRQQEPQRGWREAQPPLGWRRRRRLVVFHLVRISYVLASFPEPVLGRFSTKFADSENSLPQGAFLKGLPGFGQLPARLVHDGSPPPRELFGNFLGTFCKRPNTFDNFSIIVETSQRFPRDLPERPPRDTPSKQKSKKFTKIVAVGAGKLSSGPFCTEFWCESNRGVGFLLRVAFSSISVRFPVDNFSIKFWK